MRILVTVPNTNWIHKGCTRVLLALQGEQRYTVDIELPTERPLENNLHHIINTFMAGPYEYWLSIDSDTQPMSNPLDLVAADKDIVGLPTPVWHYKANGERPLYWNAYQKVGDEYTEFKTKQGLQRVDAIGGGCFLIARRVFENPAMRKGAFSRKMNPDGTVQRGNDISFCERATACGFEIYSAFTHPCRHFKEMELTEVQAGFTELFMAPQAEAG